MMDRIMACIRDHIGPNAVVGFMAAKGKELFYEPYGFIRRPHESMGSGVSFS
jgi:hypothetical protein